MNDITLQNLKYYLDEIEKADKKLAEYVQNSEEAEANSDIAFGTFRVSNKNKAQIEREIYVRNLREILKGFNLGLLSRMPQQDNHEGPKYLAFIDILGFQKIVSANKSAMKERYESLIITAIHVSLSADEKSRMKTKFLANGRLVKDIDEAKVNSMVFSDTIMFWTNDSSPENLLELMKVVNNLYWWSTYHTRVALRGAITYGSLDYNDPLFVLPNVKMNQTVLFGNAIVEAYQLEKRQEWMGCVIDQSCIDAFNSYNPTPTEGQKKEFEKNVIPYNIPYKRPSYVQKTALFIKKIPKAIREALKGNKEYFLKKRNPNTTEYALQWVRGFGKERDDIFKCFTINTGTTVLQAEVQKKYNNTVKFADFVLNTRFKPEPKQEEI